MTASTQCRPKPPTVSRTGLGYKYVRCQRGDHDVTVYIHQLCAIAAGEDPHDVFSDCYDTHHLPISDWLGLDEHVPPEPDLNVPSGVEIRPRWEHRQQNLKGGAD